MNRLGLILAFLMSTIYGADQATTRRLIQCHAINDWAGNPDMDIWCSNHCAIGNCPEYSCSCGQQTTLSATTVCRAINLWAGSDYLDRWCTDSCAKGNCPETSCKCTNQITSEQTTPTVTRLATSAQTESVVTPSPRTTVAPPTIVSTHKVCKATSIWKGIEVFDRWCTENCNKGEDYCPSNTCHCVDAPITPVAISQTSVPTTVKAPTPVPTRVKAPTPVPTTAKATITATYRRCSSNGVLAGDYWNQWCQKECDRNTCPIEYCNC